MICRHCNVVTFFKVKCNIDKIYRLLLNNWSRLFTSYHSFSFLFRVFFSLSLTRIGEVLRICVFMTNSSLSYLFMILVALFSILDITWWELSVDCSPVSPSPKPCRLMKGVQCLCKMCCFGISLPGKNVRYVMMYYLSI